MPHALLIAKLNAYGLSEHVCNLIISYLENREHRVKIMGKHSDWATTNRGVPQGSALGPLPFKIFFNDLFLYEYNLWNSILCWWQPSVLWKQMSWCFEKCFEKMMLTPLLSGLMITTFVRTPINFQYYTGARWLEITFCLGAGQYNTFGLIDKGIRCHTRWYIEIWRICFWDVPKSIKTD